MTKKPQTYPLRYSAHVFSRRRRELVAQRAAAQGIFEMASGLTPTNNSSGTEIAIKEAVTKKVMSSATPTR